MSEVPGDWKQVKLREVLSPVSRRSEVQSDQIYRLLGVRWYGQGTHIHQEIAGSDLKTPSLNLVRCGDITYNKMWTKKGAFALVGPDCDGAWATSEYPTFKSTGGATPEFILRTMLANSFVESARISSTGTTSRARLNPSHFLDLEILLPPLRDQRKISAILTAVDETIGRAQAVVDHLQAVKKGLIQKLLGNGIPGRHTRFKRTELGRIPADWMLTSVGACCVIRDDLRKPLNKDERARMQGPYPYYGPTRALDSISEYRLEGTYALIGEDGDHFLKFDRWSMTQLVSGKFNVNNHAHVVAGGEICSAGWFALFFRHRDLRPVLTRQGANRYKLRKSTLESLPIALPPLPEQVSICAIAQSMDKAETQGLADLEGLKAVRDALASRLLTGKLRVRPEPAQEPAP